MIRYSRYALLSLTLSATLLHATDFTIASNTTSTSAISILTGTSTVTLQEDATLLVSSGRAIDSSAGTPNITISIAEGAVIEASGGSSSEAIRFDRAATTFILNNEGSIIQSGTALDGSRAIKADKNFSVGGTISNGSAIGSSALISASNNDAIRIGSNVTLNNYGTIISTGIVNTKDADGSHDDISAYDGVAVEDDRTNAVINNWGTISGPRHGIDLGDGSSATITNYATGVITGNNGSGVGSDSTATVINYGTITGSYAGAGNVYTGNDPTSLNGDGDGVDIDGIATITNYGTIQGLGAGGVDSSGYANGAEGIAAGGGTITNYAGATIYGQSVGILIDDGANGTVMSSGRGTSTAVGGVVTITNSGTIQGATKAAIGLVGDYDDVIVNNATGVIIGGSSAVLVDALSSTTAGAAIQMGAGDDTLTNYGTITGQNGLAIDLGNGDDTLSLLGGTISGTIVGGLGDDTVVLGSAQTLSARTSLSGFENLTTQSGAILETHLSGTSAETLSFSGTVTLADGTIIKPVIVGSVSNGLNSTILSAGTLNTNVSQLRILDTSALVNFSLSQTGNDLIVTSTYDTTTLNAMSSNNQALLNALGSDESSSLLSSLYALSSNEEVKNAMKQLSPTTNNSVAQTVNVAQNTLFGAFSHRMNNISSPTQSGLSAGDEAEGTYWMEILGNTAKQKSYKGADGYRVDAVGVALGHEQELSSTEIFGLSGGYTGAKSYGRDESQGDNTSVNSLHVGAYYGKTEQDYTLNSSVIGTFNHYDGRRVVSFSGFDETEESSYNGYALGALVEVGFPIQGGFKPLIGAQYSYNWTQSYTEKGGSGALHVNANDASSIKSIVGAEYAYRDGNAATYLVGLRYLHEFADEATTTAGFISGSSTFSVTNAEAPRDAVQLDLSYECLRDKENTVRIGYTLEAKEDYLAHQLSLRMTF
ncbi:autotransporter outer membrane beta-barrel domain-containing protein [Sulfurospirillum multivorans]|uniref:Autotransporter domain-containing protein n=2 Tax=Sulfurospirillum multivorans TaxID=66821 RepID=A0AA86DYW9_SULMK|nr:autotransporter outer membrane beta-barrel domain-containing protein [Sulfurospirillum multivorans]AHJ12085.1 autotransporter domain-containing protein [Sulfurospirillum multivorans DSM 12446]QEH05586.1 autotransporter domain-containing protein [Sulfurospirillum multivorans]